MLSGIKRFACIAAAALSGASAHLEPGSLSSPEAGSSHLAGAMVTITWIQAEYHFGKYTLHWSKNGGTSWTPIATWAGPSGDNVSVNYAWTVPAEAAGTATKVGVCQLGQCGEADYTLVSGNFTVRSASALRPAESATPASLRFGVDRTLEVAFSLAQAGAVSLKAFRADGSLAAVLLAGEHAAGPHTYRLASETLRASEGFLFRLEAAGLSLTAFGGAAR